MSICLRDYQEDTVAKLLTPPESVNRSLAVLATGAGKTIVFASLLDRMLGPGEHALVLAHREELLTQAREKIALAAPTLRVEIEQADSRAKIAPTLFEENGRVVVVASVQTMRGKRLKGWNPNAFRIVVVDEAHHATAGSYVDILTHFGCFDTGTRLVGVTATPGRSDGIGLGAVFEEITVEYGIRDLIKRGHLVPLRAYRVDTGVDLRSVTVRAGDYAVGELEEAVNVDKRNREIVAAYETFANGKQGIVFCVGVQHSFKVAKAFQERGIPAEPVWGEMSKEDRVATLARYHRGETRILTNMGVLTEGFDAPQTECIILARPTQSTLLVTQMIGRGTRLHPGKEHAVVIDVADTTGDKSLACVATLAGLPPKFDPQGCDVFSAAEDLEEIDPRLQHLVVDAESLQKMMDKLKAGMSVVEIDLFAAIMVDESVRKSSDLAWMQIGPDRWAIRAEKDTTYEIHADALGRYVVMQRESRQVIGIENAMEKAFYVADTVINHNHYDKVRFLDLDARWRAKPASEKQMDLLKRLAYGRELPENLTQGNASILVDMLIQAKARRKERKLQLAG